jgi:putative PIN family toxin of toxin-antitoxin system
LLVVIDTNVLVSGLLNAQGPPGRIIDMALIDSLTAAFDDRIVMEYRNILGRDRFRPAISTALAEEVLAFITGRGLHVTAQPLDFSNESVPDPNDLMFMEVAATAGAAAIITGNTRHFEFFEGNPHGVRILTPSRALEMLC